MLGVRYTLLIFLAALPMLSSAATFRIAVLAYRGLEHTETQWAPTAEYLNNNVPGHQFLIEAMSLQELADAVQAGRVDFVITNTGQYVELEARTGISRLATLKNRVRNTTTTEFGAVIFTRADRSDIETLHDVPGKSMMALRPDGFGGYQLALRELLEANINPERDMGLLRFSGFPAETIAYAVASGEVDIGTFRSGLLEALEQEGKLQTSQFKVLNRKSSPRYPGLLSTRLYPEWPFARLRHTPLEIAESVAIALINMPADSSAARASGTAGWTVPLDYYSVHELFIELGIGPYAQEAEPEMLGLFPRNAFWLGGVSVVIAILTVTTIILVRTNFRRRKVERELTVHHEELAKVVQATTLDLVRVRDLALSASEAKSRFLANMGHELRTPLNAVIGFSEIIAESVNEAQLTECRGDVDKILSASHHLLKLIDDIFDVSTIETGKVQLHLATFSVRSMMQDVISIMRPLADANNNELIARVEETVSSMEGDLLRTKQVLFNVINNACTFTKGGSIEVRVERAGRLERSGYRFIVRDNGCGMTEAEKSRAFERFHSGGIDSYVSTRSGLGLATSRVYCEAMNGTIDIVSNEKVGTTVSIWLPELAVSQPAGNVIAA